MDWNGEATVLGRTRHGEHAVILTVLTQDTGLLRGLVPGGASPKRAAILQPGNRVALRWRARLDDQLGSMTAEPAGARPGLMVGADALAGVNALTALLIWALPERDPHPGLAAATEALLDAIDAGGDWSGQYLGWELTLLNALGFGLALDRCAVTGRRDGLAYVSPRTGHAVTAAGAGDWAARLLPLPTPLGGPSGGLAEALALTGHFLSRMGETHVGRPVPPARGRLIARLGSAGVRSDAPRPVPPAGNPGGKPA